MNNHTGKLHCVKTVAIIALYALLFTGCNKTNGLVTSPDGKLSIELTVKDSITYTVNYNGKNIIKSSKIDLELADNKLAENARIIHTERKSIDETIEPLYGKFKVLDNKFNELRIDFDGNFSILLRAYNEGVAYRFITDMDSDIIVKDEVLEVQINDDPKVLFAETSNYTSWELMYIDYDSESAIADQKKAVTPVLFSMTNGTKLVIAESDVRNYPGMYLKKNGGKLQSDFAQYPDSTALGSWGFVSVVQTRKDYIAQTEGKKEFPWRIFIVTDDDKTLLTNELIYKLATPAKINDLAWIKPGKAAWEWWHDAILSNASIPSGMANRNTDLYKHYIDFAAENNLEYLMIDAGWSDLFDLTKTNPKVDIRSVIDYGKEKNVGVFLWCTAISLTDRDDEFLKMMSDWGVMGIKVDFFDRDDQVAMQWYETIAEKAAKYKLMVNFHGCSKPTGLQRTYPNIVNFEAVRGAECSKWDLTANPQHHLTFPFVRMLGGPLDYTPGAMRNRSPQMFKPIDPGLPLSQGTRCHELAMFVIYDQYFAMLADSPSEYRKYPDILHFLSKVPVSFDQTIVLDAKVGEYALMAKQKGEEWYIGGMTNWTARKLTVDYSFLPSGKEFIAEIYRDGFDANLYADKYLYEKQIVDHNSKQPIQLAAGGGFVIRIIPKTNSTN